MKIKMKKSFMRVVCHYSCLCGIICVWKIAILC